MHRRSFLALSLATPAALVTGPALADGVTDALDKIAAARASVKTIVAPFMQVRTIGLLASDVASNGEVTVVRPDQLRWDVSPPDAITYWVLPEGLYMKSSSSSKAVKAPPNAGNLGGVLGDVLLFVGGDLRKLADRYDLRVTSTEGGVGLEAKPKSDETRKVVSRVELKTTADLWAISRFTIEEASGDRSVVSFGEAKRDTSVDPSKMKPPV
ncbi:MAG: outer membrane lipoprotein carrier protein LolA [Polyangiaceae bacterium]